MTFVSDETRVEGEGEGENTTPAAPEAPAATPAEGEATEGDKEAAA